MRAFCGALVLSLVACASESSSPTITLPPDNGVHPVYEVPGGSAAAGLVFGNGTGFQFAGATAPGSATFTAAPYVDIDQDPTTTGGGSLNITVDGQLYSAATLESIATTINDGTEDYLAIQGFAERSVPGGGTAVDAVLVIIPQSDYAPGATVALDGEKRIALFASGSPEADAPDVYAAAITGTVELGAGSPTSGGTVTATVNGDFGAVDVVTTDPTDPTSGSLTAGSYTLAIAPPADVYCDGALAGQEAAFAGITASSLGFTDGSVAVTTGTPSAISGAPIASAFGASSLDLEDAGDGLVAGFSDLSDAGPAGTTLAGKFLVFDTTSATATFVNGAAGAWYQGTDGGCGVSFSASLTAP